MESTTVLVPASYDIIWSISVLVVLAAIVGTVVWLMRRSRRRSEEIAQLRSDVDRLKGEQPPAA